VGATVVITNRVGGASVNVYSTESGGSPLGSITTDANGLVGGWIAEGSYNMAVSGGSPSITPYTEAFEAVYGAGVENVAANAIGSTQLAAGAVGTTQLANTSVTAAKIANNTITASQIANNTVTAAQIANGTITATQLSSSLPFLQIFGGSHNYMLKHNSTLIILGAATGGFTAASFGPSFPTACLYAWIGGWFLQGPNAPDQPYTFYATPNGLNTDVTFAHPSTSPYTAQVDIFAIGY
jgi:hypothetical protein